MDYNLLQSSSDQEICALLMKVISESLPGSTAKIWHGSPVWFLNDNPIVGYNRLKDGLRLLFWSGQSFDEPSLKPEGKFKAAEIRYHHKDDVNVEDLRSWLQKAVRIQWDYKNIVKHKGMLGRL